MPDLTSLLAAFLALGGVNIFLTAVINLLKYFKVVADGQAGTWALVINAVLFLAYVGGSVAGVDLTKLDSVLGSIGNVILILLPLIGGLVVGKGAHVALKRFKVPVLGFSHSQ